MEDPSSSPEQDGDPDSSPRSKIGSKLSPPRLLLLAVLLLLPHASKADAFLNAPKPPNATPLQKKIGNLHIPFIENQGQMNDAIAFYAPVFGGTLFVTHENELVYSLSKTEGEKGPEYFNSGKRIKLSREAVVRAVTLHEELVGGESTSSRGEGKKNSAINYFIRNDPSKWKKNIAAYEVVNLGEVYRGVEVKLKAYADTVEKLFYVQPGASPEIIKVRLQGSKQLRVNEPGELEVETELGSVKFSKPVAFQMDGSEKKFVEVAYALEGDRYGFKTGAYDPTKELVIDPILAATFLGGSDFDQALALALNKSGHVYVAGVTGSADFPGIGVRSADSVFGARSDAFVVKLDADLSTILAATFLGGSGVENSTAAFSLGFDSLGNVYVAGQTFTPDFPGIGESSADHIFAGNSEGFIAKLDADLSHILAATFLGGSNDFGLDMAQSLAVDSHGNVYAVGSTEAVDFPGITATSADGTFNGFVEGFVAKLDGNLGAILAATFLGGTNDGPMEMFHENVTGIKLDSSGNVYVAGHTAAADFPGITASSADSRFESLSEAFVVKLDADLHSILAATYLGGSITVLIDREAGDSLERAFSLALDNDGHIYVAGVTTAADFPGIGEASADRNFSEESEGFIAKLNADLTTILAATFLGGHGASNSEGIYALALDGAGNVYVTGLADSADFPGISAKSIDSELVGTKAFVAKLNPDLQSILAATYLGGSHFGDWGLALALDRNRNIYVAGRAQSEDFPNINGRSADRRFDGLSEAFVAKLDSNLARKRQDAPSTKSRVIRWSPR